MTSEGREPFPQGGPRVREGKGDKGEEEDSAKYCSLSVESGQG